MSWKQYLERHAQGRTNVELGQLAGVSGAQVGKWRSGKVGVDPATVIAFARAVGDKPVGALVEAGFLKPEEARQRPAAPPSVEALTDEELLGEVRARMSGGRDGREPAPIGEDDGAPPALSLAARKTGRGSRVQRARDEQDEQGEP